FVTPVRNRPATRPSEGRCRTTGWAYDPQYPNRAWELFQMQGKTEPLHNTLRLTLGLNHTETQILARLVTQGCLSREQICAITSRAHQPIKIGSVDALITGVRKKLRGHRVEIGTLNGFGFELRKADRAKVRELLTKPTRGAAVEDPPEAQ